MLIFGDFFYTYISKSDSHRNNTGKSNDLDKLNKNVLLIDSAKLYMQLVVEFLDDNSVAVVPDDMW